MATVNASDVIARLQAEVGRQAGRAAIAEARAAQAEAQLAKTTTEKGDAK